MRKYLSIALVIVVIIFIGFFWHRTAQHVETSKKNNTQQSSTSTSIQKGNILDVISDIPAQERNVEEIILSIPASNNTLKVYTVGINGKILKSCLLQTTF